LSELVVPLSKIQIDVLQLLAAHCDPESYVAGATPLNRNTVRYSDDIDVFHDREERVAVAALALHVGPHAWCAACASSWRRLSAGYAPLELVLLREAAVVCQ
jgi:hypothetical protein